MQRIVIVGTSGAGKTTLAARIAKAKGIEHIELDALHWGPHWTAAPIERFRERVADAVARDTWVIDGNYAAVRDIVWPRATTIVWLDYRFPRIFARAVRRTFRRLTTHETLWSGNRESIRATFFSRESILWWVVITYRKYRSTYPLLLSSLHQTRVLRFRTPVAAELWVQTVETSSAESRGAAPAAPPMHDR